jgi:ribosomal protein S30
MRKPKMGKRTRVTKAGMKRLETRQKIPREREKENPRDRNRKGEDGGKETQELRMPYDFWAE